MLQSTEYELKPYIMWFWRTSNFNEVAKRRVLEKTKRAKLLLLLLRGGIGLQIIIGIVLFGFGVQLANNQLIVGGILVIVSYPLVWAHAIVLPLVLARTVIVKPKERQVVAKAASRFSKSKAVKIAVAGSYGKTTMKELLKTVLSEGKIVAATPGNMNVAVSHAKFAATLTGDEQVVVIEYGEGKPGDVAAFNQMVKPTIGVITGLAPAHLDHYKTVAAAGKDIFSLAEFVGPKNVFVNDESPDLEDFLQTGYHTYNRHAVLGWKISRIKVDIEGTGFTMKQGKKSLILKSGLIGKHLVGPLAFCAALAAELGLTDAQIKAGVAKTKPFEHRMQPRRLAGGWVIDDTYNGNLEGVRAGLELLTSLKAGRKTYVTPGLVDQGEKSQDVHITMGHLIAKAQPDRVVLMQNSVTEWIKTGLVEEKFRGELIEQSDPLKFYSSLEHFLAVGDVVLMQNDWTDNYN